MSKSRYGMLGDQHPSEYNAWRNMKRWCLDPTSASYRWYGAAGVTICPEWIKSFRQFLDDVGPKPNRKLWLCRIDLAKGYEPGNVRWGERQSQILKRRNCLRVLLDGIPLTTGEAAELVGLKRKTLLWRLSQHGKRAGHSLRPTT